MRQGRPALALRGPPRSASVTCCAAARTCAVISCAPATASPSSCSVTGFAFRGRDETGPWLITAGFESLRFADLAAQASFVDYLVAVDGLAQRRGVLDRTIGELVPESPYAELIARLRCFRGIDTLSAAGICAEVGDFARFRKPKLLAGHLGITRPSGPPTRGVARAGSPRRAPSMPDACWSRP